MVSRTRSVRSARQRFHGEDRARVRGPFRSVITLGVFEEFGWERSLPPTDSLQNIPSDEFQASVAESHTPDSFNAAGRSAHTTKTLTLRYSFAYAYGHIHAVKDHIMNVEHLAQELATHLALSRPLVCVDLEATGVWPGRDRIVQIAAARIFPDGKVSTWSSLVNPEQPIPPVVTNIHGITDSMVASAPTFAQLATRVTALLSDCDLTGYNVERFDRRLLVAEFRRAGFDDPMTGARVIDAYTMFVRKEPRGLDDALRFYGVQQEEQAIRQAHDARSDVEATVAVLAAQLKTYPDLPKTVDELHEWLNPADPNRIDTDGKFLWQDGVATVAFGAQAGTSLVDLAARDRGFLEWILRKDFSDEVKTIVRDALEGRFPVRGGSPPT